MATGVSATRKVQLWRTPQPWVWCLGSVSFVFRKKGKEFSEAVNKIRNYRWELWFFFGAPITSGLLGLALYWVLIETNQRLWEFWQDLSGIVALAGVLAVSYRRVLRLNRPLLRLLWQYSFMSLTISLIFLVNRTFLISPEDLTLVQQGWAAVVGLFLSFTITLAISVWFARRASTGGFIYALVFLGLIAHSELTPFSLWAPEGRLVIGWVGLYVGVIIFTAILALVAVWVLHQADSGGVVTNRAITALFSVALLGYAAFYLVQSLTFWDASEWSLATQVSVYVTAYALFQYVLAIGLAYLARVREIEPYFDPGEQAPTDEEDDEFVGLYKREVGPS